MTDAEKVAAYDRLCEALLVPPGLQSEAAYAAVEQLVEDRQHARSCAAEAEAEVVRCHSMLGLIYSRLSVLELSLESVEQAILCPTDWCKHWKHPEWEERCARYAGATGQAVAERDRIARARRLLDWMEETHPGDHARLMPLRMLLERS